MTENRVPGPTHVVIDNPVVRKVVTDMTREVYLDDSRVSQLTGRVLSCLEAERQQQMARVHELLSESVPELFQTGWVIDPENMLAFRVADGAEVAPGEALAPNDPRVVETKSISDPRQAAAIRRAFEGAYLSSNRIAALGASFTEALLRQRQQQIERVWDVIETVYPEVAERPHHLDLKAMVVYPIQPPQPPQPPQPLRQEQQKLRVVEDVPPS